MPLIEVVLDPGNTDDNVHELHQQLLAIVAVLDSGEQTAPTFGPSTVAAVRSFRQQYGLPNGDTVDLSPIRLIHVASAFADSGDHVALQSQAIAAKYHSN